MTSPSKIRINGRARDRFPGQVYNLQQNRLRSERKFRDWEGWLNLVAERRAELQRHPEEGRDVQ
jgi:hypothetical protein